MCCVDRLNPPKLNEKKRPVPVIQLLLPKPDVAPPAIIPKRVIARMWGRSHLSGMCSMTAETYIIDRSKQVVL